MDFKFIHFRSILPLTFDTGADSRLRFMFVASAAQLRRACGGTGDGAVPGALRRSSCVSIQISRHVRECMHNPSVCLAATPTAATAAGCSSAATPRTAAAAHLTIGDGLRYVFVQ